MPNIKISQLPLATSPLDSSVVMPVVQGGVTKRAPVNTIGFSQSGAGATARTVQAKLRDTVSVKDFGAVGDNVADDSAAFANAIAAGRDVYIPAGTYRITPRAFSNLLSLKVTGAGRDVTKLILTSTGTALTFSNCQWLQLSDFSMESLGGAQVLANASGIQLDTGSSNCVIERVNVYGFSLDGIRMVGTSGTPLTGNTVRDCYVLGSGRNNVYEAWNNDATWENVQCGFLQTIPRAAFGFLSEDSSENFYSNVKIWENTRGFKMLRGKGNRVDACRFEESQQENFWFEGCDDLNFTDNRSYTGSKVGNGVADYGYFLNCVRVNFVGNNVNTWDATFGRWSVNFDGNCSDLNIQANTLGGFSAASAGPIRFAGAVTKVSGDRIISFTATGVAAGATVYPSVGANTAEAAAYAPIERQYAVARLFAATEAAPGAAQSYAYTLRKNAVDTAMLATSSGASSFSAASTTTAPQILVDEGDSLTTKLVTSGGATVTNHRGYVVLVAY